jgi:16S rRNA processing protein RimM
MPPTPPGWLRAGKVGRPHGLDGSFHVVDPNAALLTLGSMVLVDGEPRAIVRRAGTDARPVVRLEGHHDREAAQGLTGSELLVARSEAPELGPDEWWAGDLEGCLVRDGSREVGVVRRLLALPSCEVLEVARSGDGDELLVPLVSDAVRSVDVEGRLIDVDLHFLGEDA